MSEPKPCLWCGYDAEPGSKVCDYHQPSVLAKCQCGEWYDLEAWLKRTFKYLTVSIIDGDDYSTEFRDCVCGSTIGVDVISKYGAACNMLMHEHNEAYAKPMVLEHLFTDERKSQ